MTAAVLTGVLGMFVPEILGLGTGPLAAMLQGDSRARFWRFCWF